MSKHTYRVCFCFVRRFHLAAAEAPADIKKIFDDYSENGVMRAAELRRFLVEIQGERNATEEEAQRIIDGLKHLHIFQRRELDLHTFFKFLLGDDNPPLDPKLGIHQNMTAPASHYFIYTSHNTYLTGNQLCSRSSDIPISRALRAGVRVIELDLWPSTSTKHSVDVLHGWTLTPRVKLNKCLRSIKEHAFSVAFEYPVVITLEDHLTDNHQARVAEMITQTFGDMLFTPGSGPLREFPSPESLKRRIIISTKPPKEYEDEALSRDLKPKNDYDKDDDDDDDNMDREAMGSDEDDKEGDPKQAAPKYRNLIAIHAGKVKGGMQAWFKVDPTKVRRLSLSEQELDKAISRYGKDIVRFTQQNLLRIYPKGTRMDSSNYNPIRAWLHGAQMVALNMQGYDRYLWLMQGMFRANGGCGYVEKPDFLLKAGSDNEIFDPEADLPVKTILKVTVYMGEGWFYDFPLSHFDACSPPDFYAKIEIVGVTADAVKKRTERKDDNWIPTWEEVFKFRLRVPELALLRIEVRDYDGPARTSDFAGQTCLPVRELKQGIRAVPLYNRKGVKYKHAKLLMRFEFVDP